MMTNLSIAKGTDKEPYAPFLVRCLRWLDTRSPLSVRVIGALLIVFIGLLSYATGPQLSSSLFYLIPVLLVTRVAGFRQGFLAALAAAAMWLAADLNAELEFAHPVIPYWNASMRFGTFLVAVSLVSTMRTVNAQLEERVSERTAALEAEIIEKLELEKIILEISDLEQARIGQDLHDGLCQQLVSAAFSANMLQESLALESPPRAREADRIADMIDEAITQARNLARGLYPVRLETEGLEMALRELASGISRRFEVECSIVCPVPASPSRSTSDIHLYRIAQEAVLNAAKHSNAKQIIVSLTSDHSRGKITVRDDGIGIGNTSPNPDGMGLRIMEYRARMIGADFKVTPLRQGGTEVTCEFDAEKSPNQ
ncbi:MAG: sensor histidine kinase [Luteolibacter sp.]